MKISRPTLAGALIAGGAALAIAGAPLAAADSPSCVDTSSSTTVSSTQCQNVGNVELSTTPVQQQTAPVGLRSVPTTYGPFFSYDRGMGGRR